MHSCMNMHAHLDRVNGLSSLGSQFPPRTQWGTEEELALVSVQVQLTTDTGLYAPRPLQVEEFEATDLSYFGPITHPL